MRTLVSACPACLSLREDPIDPAAVIPWAFTWAGCCGGCQRVVQFEGVGVKHTAAPIVTERQRDDVDTQDA
jgi:hypothetical protein